MTMPLSTATPNTAMNPIADGTERYCLLINSPTMPPLIPDENSAPQSSLDVRQSNQARRITRVPTTVDSQGTTEP